MRVVAVAIIAVLALVGGALLTPLPYYVPERHALAQRAVAAGFPSVAAALLTPLVEMSDARALNNLGVLYARGAGPERDGKKARDLFTRAAAAGSARARLNAVMADRGGCGINIERSAATAQALQPLARTDSVAGSLIHDCLYFDAASERLPDRSDRMLAAESQPRRDPNALLHAGWSLLNLARTTLTPDFSDPDETARYEEKVIPIARKVMELLFAAAEAGATGAYEPLGILSMQFGEKLGNDGLAVRLRERDNWEWLEAGAQNGDWAAQCRVADERMTRMRYDGKPYTREEFNEVVAFARKCIDRKEAVRDPQWFDQPEWLVVTPRYYPNRKPTLEVGTTAAGLNGLLFFDADRRRNSANAQR